MSRPTVLLLHAFPLGGRMWDAQRAALEREGWTVAAPDLSAGDARPAYAETAERLLASVDGDLVVVGASMGGHLAFELWRQARGRIRALVLADTRATPDTEEQRASRDQMIAVLRQEGVDGLSEMMGAARHGFDELLREQPAEGLVATLQSMRDRSDSTATLATIDVPVLVLVGENDPVIPPATARELADGLADVRYVEIAGAGHVPALEQPQAFTEALLGFLREIDRG